MTTLPPWLLLVVNYLERLVFTFIFTAVSFTLGRDVLDIDTAYAAALAGVAACLTVLLGLLTDWVIPVDLPFGVLALLRILRTLAVTVLTILLAAPELDLSAHAWYLAFVGSLPAVLTLVKAIAAERLGAATPAMLPARADLLAQPIEPLALGA